MVRSYATSNPIFTAWIQLIIPGPQRCHSGGVTIVTRRKEGVGSKKPMAMLIDTRPPITSVGKTAAFGKIHSLSAQDSIGIPPYSVPTLIKSLCLRAGYRPQRSARAPFLSSSRYRMTKPFQHAAALSHGALCSLKQTSTSCDSPILHLLRVKSTCTRVVRHLSPTTPDTHGWHIGQSLQP